MNESREQSGIEAFRLVVLAEIRSLRLLIVIVTILISLSLGLNLLRSYVLASNQKVLEKENKELRDFALDCNDSNHNHIYSGEMK